MANGDFLKPVVETIAKRAGSTCSNPDCNALTSGPSEDEEKAIVVGEAAHIYGARESAARYVATMSDEQRADITNAIWLCRICHKKIDSDRVHHSAELLFEWRRHHEKMMSARLGRPGDAIREKIIAQQLKDFKDASHLAQQIVIDKPEFWEYKLTAELLSSRLLPVIAQWNALSRGLYVRPATTVTKDQIVHWVKARLHEAQKLIPAIAALINEEIKTAWGPPGQPGDAKEILRVCNLIVDCAKQDLQWEETVHFAIVPEEFEEIRSLLSQCMGRQLSQLARIPSGLAAALNAAGTGQVHHVSLVMDLPDGWVEKMEAAQQKAFRSLYP